MSRSENKPNLGAPLAMPCWANAMPIEPVDRLDKKRMGSIASHVGPAVKRCTNTFQVSGTGALERTTSANYIRRFTHSPQSLPSRGQSPTFGPNNNHTSRLQSLPSLLWVAGLVPHPTFHSRRNHQLVR